MELEEKTKKAEEESEEKKTKEELEQEKKDLEEVMSKKMEPIVKGAVSKILGISIDELNKDITTKLSKNPLIDFEININIPFKKAKLEFKEAYLKKLLERNYGNISEVAKIADVDRRSVHRLTKKKDAQKFRKEMLKPSYVKSVRVTNIIEDVLDTYSEYIHPEKMGEVYKNVGEMSKEIIKELPEEPMTLKEAEEEFEKEFLTKALLKFNMDVKITAKAIKLRYETLHRKAKKLDLIK
ncbi:hypothetical protein ACFL1H_00575 [Nanoarchaeota archaeon]